MATDHGSESRAMRHAVTAQPPLERPPTGADGLTATEVESRRAQSGRNEIVRAPDVTRLRLFIRQFDGAMVRLLLGASVVAALLGEVVDAIAITAIVAVNGIVGYLQESRAARALAALRSMSAPRARVRRDGRLQVIPAADVVPGDLLVLEPGDLVAADAKLLAAHALRTNEAALTGESEPVDKRPEPAPDGTPTAERHDRVWLGTAVVAGDGIAEVVNTGMQTELGRIAHLLATAAPGATPLQVRLEQLSRTLLKLCLATVAVVALLGLIHGDPPLDLLLTAVSLAVAAVPEGLPAIVTIALAIGVQRMAARNVLIRHLPAVETLGATTVICSDKTGTLTTGVMALRETWGTDRRALLDAAAACADAELGPDGLGGTGDPTELALLVAAAEAGIHRAEIERDRPRVDVIPFDAARRRMAVRRADGRLYVKGAVEAVLPLCTSGGEGAADAGLRLAGRGLRVLAVAVGRGATESNLELVGLVGIADPPRPEAKAAVAAARAAGIRTVMITGDHPVTAAAIASELGIIAPGDDPTLWVHARSTPEQKIEIVRAWKGRGAVVAMTGDGVNDAPALREAHVGVAMGRTGTEVAREAAAVVLTDDNYASLVAGVAEGRGIFDNIRRTLVYLLAGNTSELLVMLGAALLLLPLPLLPLHLLWINLVTDALPALALAMEPTHGNVLRRQPRRPDESILGRPEWQRILFVAAIESALVLAVFTLAAARLDLAHARSLAFSTLVFAELLRAFAARSETQTFWQLGALTNLRLLGAVTLSIAMQLALPRIGATQSLLRIERLTAVETGLCLGLALIPVSALEIGKLMAQRRRRRAA